MPSGRSAHQWVHKKAINEILAVYKEVLKENDRIGILCSENEYPVFIKLILSKISWMVSRRFRNLKKMSKLHAYQVQFSDIVPYF